MRFQTVLFLMIIMSVGCSTTIKKSQKGGLIDVRAKSDLQVDLDIDMTKKISGSASHTKLFGFIDIKSSTNYAEGVSYEGDSVGWFGGGVVEETKAAAAYNAVVPSKSDVIVAPQYVIKVKSYFLGIYKEVTAQVTGYSAKIKNISSVKK